MILIAANYNFTHRRAGGDIENGTFGAFILLYCYNPVTEQNKFHLLIFYTVLTNACYAHILVIGEVK